MSNWEWLYQQNAKRRRQSQMQLRMQAEQQNIQNFLLLNTDTMTYMPGGDVSGSYGFGEIDHLLTAKNNGDFDFSSSDDFCIEWFQYHYDVVHTNRSTIFSINELESFGVTFENNLLSLWIGSGTTPVIQVDFEEEEYTEKWMHVAIFRKDGVIYVYKNGLRVFVAENTTAQTDDVNVMTIGAIEFDRINTLFNGLITNLRFAIGNSIYEEGLTIPYPTSTVQDTTGVKLILNAFFTNPFKDSSSYDRTIKAVGSVERYPESPFPFSPSVFTPVHHITEYDFSNLYSYPGTGAIVYDLKSGIDAELFNSPTYVGTGPKYIEFNGTDQYLITTSDLSSYFEEYPHKITLAMWIYPSDDGVIISERGQSNLGLGWHDAQINMVGGTANFGMWDGGNITSITSSVPTPLNNWYHFVMTYDGDELFAYINGATAGNVSFEMAPPYESGFGLYYSIAASDLTNMGDSTYTNMRLGSFDVHSTDLAYEEILNEFNTSRTRFGI